MAFNIQDQVKLETILDSANNTGTVNQVLVSTGSNTLIWSNQGDISIDGSNTEILFNNSGLIGANNQFIFDKETGRVGIGTNSPTQTLDVDGTINTSANVHITGSIRDTSGSFGTSGQVLSSTETGLSWIDAGSVSGALTASNGVDNRVAVFTTGSNIEGDSNFTWDGSSLDVVGNAKISSATEAKLIIEGDTDNDTGEEAALLQFKSDGGAVGHTIGIAQGTDNDLVIAAGNGAASHVATGLSFKTKTTGTTTPVEYMSINSSGTLFTFGNVTFNELGNDLDFRVESNNNENMLFVDGGQDRVGIACSAPTVALDVVGVTNISDDLVFPTLRVTTDGHIQLYAGDTAGGYAIGVEGFTLYNRANSNHRWYIGTLADGGTSDYMELNTSFLTVAPTIVAGANVHITGSIRDSSGDYGTSGQVLSSTAAGIDWIDQSSLSVGDATTLDGVDSTSFLRSDEVDFGVTLELNGGSTYDPSSSGAGFDTASNIGISLGSGTRIAGHVVGYIRTLLAWNNGADIEIGQGGTTLIGGINLLPGSSGDAKVNGNRILTVADEGSGNGLDADTLDGQEGSYYAPLASPALTGTATAVNLTISGNLVVNGETSTINSDNLNVANNIIELNSGLTVANPNDSGIIIERGTSGDNAFMGWDESENQFILGTTTATGDSTGNFTVTPTTLSVGFTKISSSSNIPLWVDSTDAVSRIALSDTAGSLTLETSSGNLEVNIGGDASTSGTNSTRAMNISSGGDISFYEDTGVTAKFFWDSSAERLGIGTSSPVGPLDVRANTDSRTYVGTTGKLTVESGNGGDVLQLSHTGPTTNTAASVYIEFHRSASIGSSLVRMGYFGYGSTSGTTWNWVNEINGADTRIYTRDSSGNSLQHLRFAETEVNFNVSQNDIDFRVESQTSPYALFVRGSDSRVGINQSNPSVALDVTGDINATGALTATTKSFVIDHPTKPNMKLRYGSLEGPENGVYVRGRLRGNVIELPDYWVGLVDEDTITVNLTPIINKQDLFIKEIKDNKVFVEGSDQINCFFTVYGERKDEPRFEVEYNDE